MDCNLIRDKLLDYIDGTLNEKEESLVRKHIEKCNECSNEYNELKSTIYYLEKTKNNICMKKVINLKAKVNRVKTMRKIKRIFFIAIVFSLILVMTAIATDNLDYIKRWKRYSEEMITIWEKLIDSGVGQRLDISAIDKNIKVTAEGVISDELNTVVLLRIEDLKGNIKFIPGDTTTENPCPIIVSGDIVNSYEDLNRYYTQGEKLPPKTSCSSIYLEERNSIGLMINTETLIGDKGNVDICINNLSNMPNKDGESIINIKGNWNLHIPAEKIKSKSYNVNKIIKFDGNEMSIEKVNIAPTATSIEYKMKKYNSFIGVDDIKFSMRYKFKKYGYSPISYSNRILGPSSRDSISDAALESLYLENPKRIKLVIESYSYTTRDKKSYNVDINNLPQMVEYDGNKITIEDVIYNENNTEVIIKEDTNKNRKYSSSILGITAKDNPSAYCFSRISNFEFRDKNGKVLKDKEQNSYAGLFSTKQKLVLQNDLQLIEITGEEPKTYELIPEKFYIEGQRFTSFPNKKVTIKLK
ncbi:DUF4179 domain-containing protein [Tissierella praeacuta]|uniref:DUF4179 domain-containing protein n=1 Tax=Tissierella praeacuta TaxID=43131 RepID=UPI0033403CD0